MYQQKNYIILPNLKKYISTWKPTYAFQVRPDTIVELWKDARNEGSNETWQKFALSVANKGYDMILSSPWYLNYISYGEDWKIYYLVEPENFTSKPLWMFNRKTLL